MLTGHNSLSTFPISLNQETEAKKASVLLDSGISLGKDAFKSNHYEKANIQNI